MARSSDTVTYSASLTNRELAEMRKRREEVHDKGRRTVEETGRLDPLVDLINWADEGGVRTFRVSRNSLREVRGKFVLANGYAQPIIVGSDFTGSMGDNLAMTLKAMNRVDGMLGILRKEFGFNTQLACAGAQDIDDPSPVAQMGRFETGNQFVDQIRLLVPDKKGGDETEDYQVLFAYVLLATQLDLFRFYGLKGYFFFMADQICREKLSATLMQERTRHELQGGSMSTEAVVKALLKEWHLFYLNVGSGGHKPRTDVNLWWEKLGLGNRVVVVPNAEYLAETQAALLYVCEHEEPTRGDVVEFLVEGGRGNDPISPRGAEEVWSWIEQAGVEFGAQARLRAKLRVGLPQPGDQFEHYRHQWPIGHPLFEKNFIPDDDLTETPGMADARRLSKGKPRPFDWGKF